MFSERPPMRDHVFEVERPAEHGGSWWFLARGRHLRTLGPYPTFEAARSAQHAMFLRWAAAARRRGGWLWKQRETVWVVTLPEGVPTDGVPLEHEACSRASS